MAFARLVLPLFRQERRRHPRSAAVGLLPLVCTQASLLPHLQVHRR